MANYAAQNSDATRDADKTTKSKYGPGVLAGVEWCKDEPVQLDAEEKREIKMLVEKAAKRDYPARLIEVIQAWEAALFYRGFQFLIPQRQGGWIIPGESTGYGPSMQLDLALLPTNIYSTYAQILISALTRSVPPTRFEPQSANNDADITAAESADKFVKVIERNNDLIMTQTDAARYLFTDGRAIYWNRFVKDGQRFGWEQDDQPNDIVPETATDSTPVAAEGQDQTGGGGEGPSAESAPPEQEMVQAQEVMPPDTEEQSQPEEPKERTPRGQEVRTAHGKLDFKLIPMMANDIPECHAVQFETEVDSSTAKGMFPDVADEIKEGTNGLDEGEIARLARLNVKLGMQSTYITSDSIADDVTIQRTWMRRSYFMHAKEGVRDRLIAKFPDGCKVIYAGTTLCCAYNESMDDSLALIQAFSGDGQNRNALGTSLMPVQKRLNNWLDLMNDFFVRCVPKKWMHNKAFDVEAIRQQTNIPGDIGAVKPQAGFTDIRSLIFVEEAVQAPASLAEFCKEYSGPLAELVTGAYPALSGGDTGQNDTARGIAIQRDQALGRLGPTWHSIKNAEATSMKQLVRWGAKCRDNSINEKIPGGETIMLEVNNLQGNIMCFPESDENIPESYTQKQNRLVQFMQDSAKNPMLAEALYNAANLEFLQRMVALTDLYLPQVQSRNKQLGEIELLLKGAAIPNPQIQEAVEKLSAMKAQGVPPEALLQAEVAAEQLATKTPEVSSVPINEWDDDKTELETCWQVMTSPEGRKLQRTQQKGFQNLVLHWKEHTAALQAKNAGAGQPGKPPSESIGLKDVPTSSGKSQLLAKGGIQVPPEAIEADEQQKQIAAAAAKPEPKGPMVQ